MSKYRHKTREDKEEVGENKEKQKTEEKDKEK